VLPSPINWNYGFANADFMRNRTIYLTVIIVCLLYLLLLIYARYADIKDRGKVSLSHHDDRVDDRAIPIKMATILLADNQPTDGYRYQIVVATGHRTNAGTRSQVCSESISF
jgi:hypothetical protein